VGEPRRPFDPTAATLKTLSVIVTAASDHFSVFIRIDVRLPRKQTRKGGGEYK